MNGTVSRFMILGLTAGLSLVATSAHAISVRFLYPGDRQAVSGVVGVRTEVSPDVVKVEYTMENGGSLQTITEKPYFYYQWDTAGLTPGVHSIAARAYDAQGNSQFTYNIVLVGADPKQNCQEMVILVNNTTPYRIGGGFWGSGLGSSGWDAPAGGSSYVGVYAVPSPNGYDVTGVIQDYGDNYSANIVCTGHAPAAGVCPISELDGVLNVISTGEGQPPVCNLWLSQG